jgi:hypothetical protein
MCGLPLIATLVTSALFVVADRNVQSGVSGLKYRIPLHAEGDHDTMTGSKAETRSVGIGVPHSYFVVGVGVSMRGSISARVAAL